jgi:hypothetical protein
MLPCLPAYITGQVFGPGTDKFLLFHIYCYKSNTGCQILKIEHILKIIHTFVVIHVFLFWISQEITGFGLDRFHYIDIIHVVQINYKYNLSTLIDAFTALNYCHIIR